MGKFGWIIFLIIIAANAIGPILKKREEQARKKRQSGAAPAAEAKPRSPAAQPHTTGPGSSRMEQLIARRQAQLEELRQRREHRRTGQSPQARIGPASTPTPPRPSPTVFRAPPPQPSRRVTRPTTAQPSASLPSAARPARTQPPQRRRVSEGPAAQPVERKRLTGLHAEPAASARPTAAPKPFLSLDAQTITPQLLRRLVVLKEIFDPPVALRNRDIWDRAG